jgi:hypothetical protein
MIGRKTLNNLRGRAESYHDAWKRAERGQSTAVSNLGRLASKHDALTRVVAEYIVGAKGEGLTLARQVSAAGIDLSIEFSNARRTSERDPIDGAQVGPMSMAQALALSQATVRTLLEQLAELQAANESAHGFAPKTEQVSL